MGGTEEGWKTEEERDGGRQREVVSREY